MPSREVDVKHRVFVYGTLKKGECNHHLLAGFHGVSARVEGVVLHAGPEHPFAVRGTGTVYGEVYTIDSRTLEKLDVLEEHPDYYLRELMPVRLADGSTVQAWIYLNEAGRCCPRIAGGLWRGVRPS